jgi:hypothetical protein
MGSTMKKEKVMVMLLVLILGVKFLWMQVELMAQVHRIK